MVSESMHTAHGFVRMVSRSGWYKLYATATLNVNTRTSYPKTGAKLYSHETCAPRPCMWMRCKIFPQLRSVDVCLGFGRERNTARKKEARRHGCDNVVHGVEICSVCVMYRKPPRAYPISSLPHSLRVDGINLFFPRRDFEGRRSIGSSPTCDG